MNISTGKSTPVSVCPTPSQRQHFEDHGYVIARQLIEPDRIAVGLEAVNRILDRALAGEFGDDFQWVHEEARLPTLKDDLLTPEKYDPAFGRILEPLLHFTEDILQKPVRCSWLLLLTGGAGVEYGVPLHRDDSMVGIADELAQIMRFAMNQTYFQAPLLPDERFLQVVPGSHLRLATNEETAAAQSVEATQSIPGLITIELQPGDVVFRHANLLHQGWNPEGVSRWTLVSALWAADMPLLETERRYADDLSDAVHVNRFPPRLRLAVERYLEASRNRDSQ